MHLDTTRQRNCRGLPMPSGGAHVMSTVPAPSARYLVPSCAARCDRENQLCRVVWDARSANQTALPQASWHIHVAKSPPFRFTLAEHQSHLPAIQHQNTTVSRVRSMCGVRHAVIVPSFREGRHRRAPIVPRWLPVSMNPGICPTTSTQEIESRPCTLAALHLIPHVTR